MKSLGYVSSFLVLKQTETQQYLYQKKNYPEGVKRLIFEWPDIIMPKFFTIQEYRMLLFDQEDLAEL